MGKRGRLEAVQVAAWSAWSAALLSTGATAYFIFTLLKRLDVRLPAFEAYGGEHWRLAGGYVAERLFLAADTIGLLAVAVGGGAFALGCWRGRPAVGSWVAAVRALLVLGMVGVMTYRFAALEPAMASELASYRQAAREGDTQAALASREAYDRQHATASTAFGVTFVLTSLAAAVTLATLGGGAAATERVPAGGASRGGSGAGRSRRGVLQEPALARKGSR